MLLRNKLLMSCALGAVVASLVPLHRARAAACTVNDLSFTVASAPPATYTPVACVNAVNNGNPTQETNSMNAALGTAFMLYGASDGTTSTIDGIKFTVGASGTQTGTWTLSWQDVNGPTPDNLPIFTNLNVGLFGGSTGDAYEFTNVLLTSSPTTGTGEFDIVFMNHGQQVPDLSHLTISGLLGDPPPTHAPEPLSLAVLGAGMLGLGWARRNGRRRTV